MAILVTGGAGYIGSHTVVELLAAGHEVVIVDNFSNSKPEVLNRIRQISGKDFAFYQVDVLDKDAMRQVFKENDIQAVIHFSGYKAVGESVAEPIKYYHNNVGGAIACHRHRGYAYCLIGQRERINMLRPFGCSKRSGLHGVRR